MSIEVMTKVLNHSRATGRAKLVLIGIANHQGDNGAWPSIETLARYANASERSVMRDIKELEDLGELFVERNAAPVRGQYRPNLYWVTIGSGVTEIESGVTDSTSGVTDEVVRGDSVVTLNIINHKETSKEYAQQVERQFDEFWKIYPLRVGKQKAKRVFAKAVAQVGFERILEGAKRYSEDPNRVQAFTKHPTTWLTAGSWDDEPLPARVLSLAEKRENDERERQVRLAQERARLAAEKARRDAEEQERLEELKRNPVKYCEHDKVAVMCLKCRNQ